MLVKMLLFCGGFGNVLKFLPINAVRVMLLSEEDLMAVTISRLTMIFELFQKFGIIACGSPWKPDSSHANKVILNAVDIYT